MKEVLFKAIVLFTFIVMALGCFYGFLNASLGMLNQILQSNDLVIFNKGAFYLLGVTLGLGVLVFVMVYQGVLKKELTASFSRWFSRIAVFSVLLIVVLPVVSHFLVEPYLLSRDYRVCTEASHTWFYLSEIVYVKNEIACGLDGFGLLLRFINLLLKVYKS